METCIFCDIISKKEEAYIVYEDKFVCCFLDKYPITNGHILVVPKKHYQEFSDVDQDSLAHVIHAAQRVAIALERLLETDGITVLQNNGQFKDVEHYHMHVFPRYINDGFSWIEPDNSVSKKEFEMISTSLKRILEK
ncbi:HIT family protein [Ornithinibacillus halotolerans]|uniref:HIT family protein n=1 Tax=Ornithinibacillus halotolerans TaxID=1274357 RepID=A0A916RV72_9BACI|nr:HIT domain-containing protein [Ornithinibacillus halotolerans]GGA67902.1 HIT family protein [Ornithinibacillus halotolerans]